jgi:hypothetical protein
MTRSLKIHRVRFTRIVGLSRPDCKDAARCGHEEAVARGEGVPGRAARGGAAGRAAGVVSEAARPSVSDPWPA